MASYQCGVLQFENDKEAAEALIRYQAGKLKLNNIGLVEFAEVNEVEAVEVMVEEYQLNVIGGNMDDVNMNDFFEQADANQADKPQKLVLVYNRDDFEKVNTALRCHPGTNEQIIFKLLCA